LNVLKIPLPNTTWKVLNIHTPWLLLRDGDQIRLQV